MSAPTQPEESDPSRHAGIGRLFGDSSRLAIVSLGLALLGFVTTLEIAGALGPADFGELAYAIAIGGVVGTTSRFGLDRSLLRDLVQSPDHQFWQTLSSSILARLLLLAVCVAACGVTWACGAITGLSLGSSLVIVSQGLLALELNSAFDARGEQLKHLRFATIYRLAYCGVVWTVAIAPTSLTISVIGAASLITVALYLALQYKHLAAASQGKLRIRTSIAELRNAMILLRQSAKLWATSLLSLGSTSAVTLILNSYASRATLGAFYAAHQLSSLAAIAFKSASRIARPLVARTTTLQGHPTKPTSKAVQRYLAVLLLPAAALAIPAALAPSFLITSAFSVDFKNAAELLPIVGLTLIPKAVGIACVSSFVLFRRDSAVFLLMGISALISLSLTVYLSSQHGAFGAACAALVAETTTAALAAIYLLRQLWINGQSQLSSQAST